MIGLYRAAFSDFLSTTPRCRRSCKKATFTRALLALPMGLLLCLDALHAQDIDPEDIEPFEVVYEIGNHLITAGTAKVSLEREGDLWTYSLKTTPRGIVALAGKGNINEVATIRFEEVDGQTQLLPQTYLYRQDKERRRAVDATFDWDTQSVTHTYRGEEVTQEFDYPLIDRLSATLLMMNALRKDFDYAELKVFDTGRIKTVSFTLVGKEMLETPLGNIETLRVINQNAQGSSRQTTTWFAPSLDYVPVKIEQRKRGELVARLKLVELKNRVTQVQIEPTE